MEKKNLLINCDLCDARNVKEEVYASYEHIVLNCDYILVNEQSKSVLSRLPIAINSDGWLDIPEGRDVPLKTVNGSMTLGAGSAVQPDTVLIVNGSLTISPDAESVLPSFQRIAVNGSVRYPESLEGLLGCLSVNGSASVYPAGYTLLDRRFTLDEYFPLRAKKDGRYYAAKRVTVKPAVDVQKLIDKNVRFQTPTLLVPEEKAEACAEIFDEQTRFIVVPKGMALLDGDTKIDAMLIRRHGKRLFVYGDATLGKGFEALEKLIVKGEVRVKKEQEEAFFGLDAECDSVMFDPDGRFIRDAVYAKIDRGLLERSPDGVYVQNVAKVALDKDLTPEEIMEKVHLENIAKVACTEAQEAAVAAVAVSVAVIGEHGGEHDENESSPFAFIKSAANTKIINADSYVM